MIFIIMVALEYNIKMDRADTYAFFFYNHEQKHRNIKSPFLFLSSNHAARASCMGNLERNLVLFPDLNFV